MPWVLPGCWVNSNLTNMKALSALTEEVSADGVVCLFIYCQVACSSSSLAMPMASTTMGPRGRIAAPPTPYLRPIDGYRTYTGDTQTIPTTDHLFPHLNQN